MYLHHQPRREFNLLQRIDFQRLESPRSCIAKYHLLKAHQSPYHLPQLADDSPRPHYTNLSNWSLTWLLIINIAAWTIGRFAEMKIGSFVITSLTSVSSRSLVFGFFFKSIGRCSRLRLFEVQDARCKASMTPRRQSLKWREVLESKWPACFTTNYVSFRKHTDECVFLV